MGAEFTCAPEYQKPNKQQTRIVKLLHTVQSKITDRILRGREHRVVNCVGHPKNAVRHFQRCPSTAKDNLRPGPG